MFAGFKQFLRAWRGLKAFKAVPRGERRIVFYSEGGGYWSHFEPVFKSLRADFGEPVLYVTSSEDDPLLHAQPPGLRAFFVGAGSVRTLFFSGLEADVLLMTMPDLNTFHIKRSLHPVKYVYLHHSMVSTHMVYRPAAFDAFDAILCVGPHHVAETRAREKQYGLPAKELVEHGYGRLDTVLSEAQGGPHARDSGDIPHVLVAPSWGESGLLELHAVELLRHLLAAGLQVTLRPHPRTRKLRPEVLDTVLQAFGDHERFSLDDDLDARHSLHCADVMVSDWSGAALEYALSLERPVIFVDVPRKVQNADYAVLGLTPLEVQIRDQVGRTLAPKDLAIIGNVAREMADAADRWWAAACSARNKWVFNLRSSGTAAAAYLHSLPERRV